MPDPSVHAFEARDGTPLVYRSRTVAESAGSLLFVHGLGDHSGWFEPLATACNLRGLDWYGLDLRGHGLSAGKRGHVDSFDDLLRDLDVLRRHVCGANVPATGGPPAVPRERPLVVGGHSMGGLLALRYAQENAAGLAGLLLVAPFLAIAARVPAWKRLTGRLANRLFPQLTFDNGLVTAELIGDPAALAAHEGDPLMHRRISARLWAGILLAQKRARSQAPLPALFQLAGDDRAVQTRVAGVLCESWERPSRCVVYPRARHDLYHDRVAARALTDAVDWMTQLTIDETT